MTSQKRKPLIVGSRRMRKTSPVKIAGLPLYQFAMGPDPENGEYQGHARAIFAFGDYATGVVAFGGVARGLIAFGGFALGAISFGGAAVGLLAFGGGAVGLLAAGGGAIGVVAIGGGAIGHYASAFEGALGNHIFTMTEQEPTAKAFFEKWFSSMPVVKTILSFPR